MCISGDGLRRAEKKGMVVDVQVNILYTYYNKIAESMHSPNLRVAGGFCIGSDFQESCTSIMEGGSIQLQSKAARLEVNLLHVPLNGVKLIQHGYVCFQIPYTT